jgi:hypothetical protein
MEPSAFGDTFRMKALVDSVDNHTLPDLAKGWEGAVLQLMTAREGQVRL